MTRDPDTDSLGLAQQPERDGQAVAGEGVVGPRGPDAPGLRDREPLRTLGLFEGIGGIALGLERTGGFKHTCFVEIDPFCQAVLNRHWPDVELHGDIRTFQGNPDEWDVITAGFPCQPASLAGRRKGAEDERWLWPETARVIGEVRPRYVLVENVRGLCSRGLPEVLADLARMGYDSEWQIVSAASVGAPHLRERVCLVAYPAPDPKREQLRLEPWRGGGTSGERATLARYDGPEGALADAYREGRFIGTWRINKAGGWAEPTDGGAALADAGRPRRRSAGLHPRVYVEADGGGSLRAAPRADELARAWSTEPDVGRVAHGVPSRLDRLRVLGNAVVPQVAEFVGGLILDREAALESDV